MTTIAARTQPTTIGTTVFVGFVGSGPVQLFTTNKTAYNLTRSQRFSKGQLCQAKGQKQAETVPL